MALLTKGIDLFHEMRGRNNQLRAEGIAIGKEMGLEQGREQGQAEIRDRLRELGLNLDELLRSDDDDADGDEAESEDGDEESGAGETNNP